MLSKDKGSKANKSKALSSSSIFTSRESNSIVILLNSPRCLLKSASYVIWRPNNYFFMYNLLVNDFDLYWLFNLSQISIGSVKPRTSRRVLFAKHNNIVLVAMSFKSSHSSVDIFSGLSFSLSATQSLSVIFSILGVFTFKVLIVPSRVSKLFNRYCHKAKSSRPSKGSIEMLEPFTDVIPCSFTPIFFLATYKSSFPPQLHSDTIIGF